MTRKGEAVPTVRDLSIVGHQWMSEAACARPEHRDLPWVGGKERFSDKNTAAMLGVCLGCPVLDQCGAYAAAAFMRHGFWAGSHRYRDSYVAKQHQARKAA